MGIFKHKDKTRPDLVASALTTNPTSGPAQIQTPAPTSNNSFNDLTYYSSSNGSNSEAQRLSNSHQQRAQGQQPGTTVTTTTTTTTMAPDGSTYTISQPYNPSNDPPPQTETTFNPQTHNQQTQNLAPTPVPLQSQTSGHHGPSPTGDPTPLQTQKTSYESQQPHQNGVAAVSTSQTSSTTTKPALSRMQTPPRKPTPQQAAACQAPIGAPPTPKVTPPTPEIDADSVYQPPTEERRNSITSGGRTIPQRTELMSPPPRSQKRILKDLYVQPLSPQKSNSPTSPNFAAPLPPLKNYEEVSPVSPVAGRSHTPNSSRPGVTPTPAPVADVTPAPTPSTHGAGGKRDSVMSAFKGLHGAGEALRGTVNSTIAKGMHDSAEEERQRAIREQGMSEFRGSGLREQAGGLREGFRQKAEERNRLRRVSAQRQQVGHTLDRVEEREVGA